MKTLEKSECSSSDFFSGSLKRVTFTATGAFLVSRRRISDAVKFPTMGLLSVLIWPRSTLKACEPSQ